MVLIDQYNRKINYLRISVTDRCNLRCQYCMPEEGITLKKHKDILTYDEILRVIETGASLGINKIRLTGGEPLVRKGITGLISQIKSINRIEDIGLTTNGILLPVIAGDLRKAGLNRVNISLDTLDPVKYKTITRIGTVKQAIEGIFAAREAGLDPIKINFVRIKGVNEADEAEVAGFCEKYGFQIRFIRQMNLQEGEFYPVEGGMGGVCEQCNRMRLTADGYIIPCLFSDYGYNIKEFGTEQAFYLALNKKPKNGKAANTHHFYNIGG